MKAAELALAMAWRAKLADGSARQQRIGSGVSLSDAARALGISHQRLSGWETGRHVPSAEHALAYARLLARLGRKAA